MTLPLHSSDVMPNQTNKEQTSSGNDNKALSKVESVQGDVFVSKGKDGQVSVFLVVWVAFYHSLQTTQNKAVTESQQSQQLQNIQEDLVSQLQGINYKVMPEGASVGAITYVNNHNQLIQAHISIMQDKVGGIQHTAQVLASKTSTTAQSAAQTLNTGFSTSQIYLKLIQNISSL